MGDQRYSACLPIGQGLSEAGQYIFGSRVLPPRKSFSETDPLLQTHRYLDSTAVWRSDVNGVQQIHDPRQYRIADNDRKHYFLQKVEC